MGLERFRAIEDFDSARARAFWRHVRSVLTGRVGRLRSIEPVLRAAGLEGRAFGGVREIPVEKIAGSVAPDAKTGDFDAMFLPVNRRMRDRWARIYQAMVEGDELPPIDVYKVDDRYYVIDGHHRVSVARNLGRPTINARVIEVRTRAPLGEGRDAASLLSAAEYAETCAALEDVAAVRLHVLKRCDSRAWLGLTRPISHAGAARRST